MKSLCTILATALAITLQAAVPVSWTATPASPPYAPPPVPHGSAIEFSVTLKGFSDPAIADGADVRLWYQTNGMGSAWFSTPATLSSNVVSATFGASQDVGADRVSLFFGAPSNVFASAILRLTHAPGFAPAELELPTRTLDFSSIVIQNIAALTNGWDFGVQDLSPATNFAHDVAVAATNYTDSALAQFATTGEVFRALSTGGNDWWIDSTGCVWEVIHVYGEWTQTVGDWNARAYWITAEQVEEWQDIYYYHEGWYLISDGSYPSHCTDDYYATVLEATLYEIATGDTMLVQMVRTAPHTNLVGVVATSADIPTRYVQSVNGQTNEVELSAEDIGAAPESLVQTVTNLQVESSLIYRLYSGSNVVAEVTNYNSRVHAPALRLMQLNESNEYITVWTETNGLARTLRDASNYTDRAIADYAAPRAWSGTTSGLGVEAPSNTTWISTPITVIAGGFEYAKCVDTYGEVWVLTSNGMAAEFNPDTNAYFRITADDGTAVFSIEKSDAQLVGAHADGITIGASTITIPVPVVSSTAPTMYWRYSLSSDLTDESSPPPGATVTWSGMTGAWVCTISFSGQRPPALFITFRFLQEGGVVIRNNATTDLSSGIWVNGTKFVPSVSGNNLIWTKQ